MEFLDTPQKISSLRKRLKLKQYEFETDNFSRGYLGLIESGRRKLTKSASDVIVKRFRERINELGLNIEIDDNYFMRTPKEDAIKYCSEKLKDEKIVTEEELIEVISICSIYKLHDLQAKAYIFRGIHYVNAKNYNSAYMHFLNALNCTTENTLIDLKIKIFINLGSIRIKLLDHIGAIQYYQKALDLYSDNDISNNDIYIHDMSILYYNISLCYKHIGEYENCLNAISKSLSLIDSKSNFDKYIDRMSLKALCYRNLGNLDESIKIFYELIDFIKYIHNGETSSLLCINDRLTPNEKVKLAYIYNNLGEIFIDKEDFSRALDFLNDAEKIRLELDPSTMSHTLFTKCQLFFKNKDYETALEESKKALEFAEKYDDSEYIVNIYCIMEQCYKLKNDTQGIESILLRCFDVYLELDRITDCIDVCNKLMFIYRSRGYSEGVNKCQENINMLIESNKKNNK